MNSLCNDSLIIEIARQPRCGSLDFTAQMNGSALKASALITGRRLIYRQWKDAEAQSDDLLFHLYPYETNKRTSRMRIPISIVFKPISDPFLQVIISQKFQINLIFLTLDSTCIKLLFIHFSGCVDA